MVSGGLNDENKLCTSQAWGSTLVVWNGGLWKCCPLRSRSRVHPPTAPFLPVAGAARLHPFSWLWPSPSVIILQRRHQKAGAYDRAPISPVWSRANEKKAGV